MPNNIEDEPTLRRHSQSLAVLGIVETEQFVEAARVAPEQLSRYLGESAIDLANGVQFESSISAASLDDFQNYTYALGVDIQSIPRFITAPDISLAPAAPPPAIQNLISPLVPVKNQDGRGTCVAHAALAAYEIYMASLGSYQDMSEQFLYWNCKRNDGIPTKDGTWLGVAYPLIKQDGCCLEMTWAYNGVLDVNNIGQNPPPAGAQMQALSYRISNFKKLSPTSVPDIKNELARGRCVSFSIPVYDTFVHNNNVLYTGDLIMPIPGEVLRGGHAMCIVGNVDMPGNPEIGGGRFIIRNSWGTANFGVVCPYGAGYGTIPYSYIAKFASEAYSLI